MKIAILLFENITSLDVIGPYEVLSKIPNVEILFTGQKKGLYGDGKSVALMAKYTLNDITQADILLVPGGFGIDALLTNREVIDWLRKLDDHTTWTASVCSGSILLAEAGLLDGKSCTTHWRRKNQLKNYKVNISDKRYIRDGKYITSAGVSAGIDMALYLVSLTLGDEFAQTIQLAIEYDPQPPFDTGSPIKAPHSILKNLDR